MNLQMKMKKFQHLQVSKSFSHFFANFFLNFLSHFDSEVFKMSCVSLVDSKCEKNTP